MGEDVEVRCWRKIVNHQDGIRFAVFAERDIGGYSATELASA